MKGQKYVIEIKNSTFHTQIINQKRKIYFSATFIIAAKK